MKVSVTALYFFEYPLEDIFKTFSTLEFKSMEFHLELYQVWFSKQKISDIARQVKELSESYNIELQLHAPYLDINLLSYNPHIRTVSEKQILDALDFASMADIDVVTVHLGTFPFGLSINKSSSDTDFLHKIFSSTIESLKRIHKKAKNLDINVGFENLHSAPGKFPKTIEEFDLIFEQIPDAKVTFDLAHAYTISKENANALLEGLHNRIVNIHVSDVDPKTNAHHIGIGEGKVDFIEFFKLLKKYNIDCPIVMELDAIKLCKARIDDREYRLKRLAESKEKLLEFAKRASTNLL